MASRTFSIGCAVLYGPQMLRTSAHFRPCSRRNFGGGEDVVIDLVGGDPELDLRERQRVQAAGQQGGRGPGEKFSSCRSVMPRIIAGYNERVDEQQIRELIDRMNRAWLEGPIEDLPAALDACFHPAMVIRGGDLQVNGAGKEACIQSYIDFLESAVVHRCMIDTPEIDIAGDTAMAVYGWEMTYEIGRPNVQRGRFGHPRAGARRAGWLITWRAMLPAFAE